jgi:PhnB protein
MAKKKSSKKKPVAKAKKSKVKAKKALPVPKGYHTVQAYLVMSDAKVAMQWYEKAFGGKVLSMMEGPDGRVMHAEVRIGDSVVMMADESNMSQGQKSPKNLGATSGGLMLYVKDVDAWFKRAVSAGATVRQEVADQFWGDRFGSLADPFGHHWSIATHKVDLSAKQMKKASEDFFKQMAQQSQQAA